MEGIEFAQQLESISQTLAFWPPVAATFAGITTMVILAVGGFWARNYR